jgi:hypothetical protein
MKKSEPSEIKAFDELLVAAMLDAAIERKMTQLKARITPKETGRETFLRIIVVPETMDVEVPQGFRR